MAEFVIECPARCAERGCEEHVAGTWRVSKRLHDSGPVRARIALREHAKKYPKSGPYRLRRV